jgi:F-type H+-transporting ATPase subunit epsilon
VAIEGGFLSVTEEGVSVLAESAQFASEIDESAAQEDSKSDDPRTAARGRGRLRAVGALD